ncbi:DHHC palmitoyltransferase-domain-containing protein [Lipomyces arxii]|uniref:DHHC palmitoyltransferase-domain-containing protein n=1 Tax=Lipomyces arxii TaxID=56418 RepID=UPI0034CF0E80
MVQNHLNGVPAERYCTPQTLNALCCSMATGFPWVMVNVILMWAAYVLVIDIGVLTLNDDLLKAFVILFGTVLYSLTAFTYYMIVRYGAIGPSRSWPPIEDENADLEAGTAALLPHAGVLAKENGQQRYCNKCKCWKPDRTHHCSTCKTCVLKMDHHCPWFSVCIGFDNQKYFLLLLFYIILFCIVCLIGSGVALLNWIDSDDFGEVEISLNHVFLFILAVVLGLAVGIFFGCQVYLLLSNKTTIEAMETQRYKSKVAAASYRHVEAPSSQTVGNVFNIGWKENFKEVFGDNPILWLLPVRTTKGNGMSFPVNQQVLNEIRRQADQESQMLSNLQGWLDRNSRKSGDQSESSLNLTTGNLDDEMHGRVSVEFRPSDRRRS